MDLEQILLKTQKKAKKLLAEVERAYRNDDSITPDDIIKISDKVFGKTGVEQPKEARRLSIEDLNAIYQKSGLSPSWPEYWFHPDLKINPLIQVNHLCNDKTRGTPIAAMCLAKRQEVCSGTSPLPDYIKANSVFVEGPSNKWYLGQLSQLLELSCSYLLGFEIGYAGNFLCKTQTLDVINGYEDGKKYRNHLIESKILEVGADLFENEQDQNKLFELYRIGYYSDTEE